MEEDSLVSRGVYARFLMQITTPEEAKIPQCSYQKKYWNRMGGGGR